MRRAGALLALAALAALLVLVGGRSPGRAHAATQNCVEHTKRVVRHVKRHGKRTRMVRSRHFRTCEEAPVAGPSAPAVASPAPGPTPAAPSSSPLPAAPGPSPSPIPAPVIVAPPTEVPAGPQPQPEPEANAVGVIATDVPEHFTYTPSRTTVRPGQLTVQLNNQGEDPHDMYMEKVGPENEPEGEVIKVSSRTEPAMQTTKSIEVEAGTYRMWCSFGEHAKLGMETHITVAE